MPDIEPRLLRHFVAVARELHFGRAAAGIPVAQQALSRDIARLERDLGVRLFSRTTRRVTLTPDGERLLPRAVELLALHDRMVDDVRGAARPLLVDVMHDASTPMRALELARSLTPGAMLESRFHGGLGAALNALLEQRLDVAFGRVNGTGLVLPREMIRRLVRLEPLGLLMLHDHPLAHYDQVPTAVLAGMTIDTSAGNPEAPEWVDLGAEFANRCGAYTAPAHHPGMAAVAAAGAEETTRHLRSTGWPILTKVDVAPVPEARVHPLVDPVPLYPWSMVYAPTVHHPGLDALLRAVERLARTERWLDPLPTAWLPAADRALARDLM